MTETRTALMERAQPLFILPTLAFWNRRENWRPVRGAMAVVGVTYVVLAAKVIPFASPLTAGLCAASAMYLTVGVLERVLRVYIKRRHKTYERLVSSESRIEGPADE